MKTILLPGRWQAPGGPHAGHRYLIDKALEEGHRVVIGVRDMPRDEKNPHDVETRMAQFRSLYGDKVSFVTIPEDGDGLDVWYGRGVGWGIHEIEVPDSVTKISATRLRALEESTLLFTGMPCSGKTTLCKAFKPMLEQKGYKVLHLDGDKLRTGLCSGLGFTNEDRAENLRRVASVAELANKEKIVVLASYVSPTESLRSIFRDIVSNLSIVHVQASSDECANRDVKGMWAQAKEGKIKGFTGYDAPYDAPEDAELVINTENISIEDGVRMLMSHYGL